VRHHPSWKVDTMPAGCVLLTLLMWSLPSCLAFAAPSGKLRSSGIKKQSGDKKQAKTGQKQQIKRPRDAAKVPQSTGPSVTNAALKAGGPILGMYKKLPPAAMEGWKSGPHPLDRLMWSKSKKKDVDVEMKYNPAGIRDARFRRNLIRKKAILDYFDIRHEYKKRIKNARSWAERMTYYYKLRELPTDSCPTKYKNRCLITGRARGYYRFFQMCRHQIRELANNLELPGVVRASW